MNKRVLLVDDDPNVLQGFKRNLRKHYELSLAVGPHEALATIRNEGPFAVVVSDMQMPEISGVELLARVRELHEQTVRVMLTGNADQKTAVDAVNEGCIFRFLGKPCPPEVLAKTLDSALEQYRLVTAEAELLSKTVSGSIRVLTQVLSLAMPEAFGLTQEARTLAREVGKQMNVQPLWELEMAAMLMRLGYVSLPAEIAKRYLRAEPLDGKLLALVDETPALGSELVASIPRLENVAALISRLNDPPSPQVPVASQILKIVGDFQRYRHDRSPLVALREMEGSPAYDPKILALVAEVVEATYRQVEVLVSQLTEGMVLEEHLLDHAGRILVAKGHEVHDSLIQKLKALCRSGNGVQEPILVRTLAPVPDRQPEAEAVGIG
ncbi:MULTISPECIES: response regulator [Crateriforma]|uniref:Hydrogenase transcriptional regulatory protein hupR1 n=1 Tax=Crateriforma conspicua TaxID=2527996 RepID=A0A5C6FIU7_9PLAN|nr:MULTISPECIES: response regulator [Crateriforma]TWU62040.1 Hydrogenase transcriptional regulatory protein hupR1 [Crateriforma conspicua]